MASLEFLREPSCPAVRVHKDLENTHDSRSLYYDGFLLGASGLYSIEKKIQKWYNKVDCPVFMRICIDVPAFPVDFSFRG